jgi:acyl carrier protein
MSGFTRSEIFSCLCRQLRQGFPDIEHPIAWDSSLTRDLHVDSTQLVALLAFARQEIADVDFGPWYAEASHDGCDTVGSLVTYLQRAAAPAGAGEGGER